KYTQTGKGFTVTRVYLATNRTLWLLFSKSSDEMLSLTFFAVFLTPIDTQVFQLTSICPLSRARSLISIIMLFAG
ncbi:MAG: hypothetical protein WC785_11095, partial [Tatlockia sp.]